ncbi:hypothetical protein VTK73DRAFT_5193 [Phialemonium thermophilum]|uniref:Uncharacterized protein n=1 Tax=Phialemonium thermophilum TaxID=223376 RepID=A0ABR3WPJ0_9PEZI
MEMPVSPLCQAWMRASVLNRQQPLCTRRQLPYRTFSTNSWRKTAWWSPPVKRFATYTITVGLLIAPAGRPVPTRIAEPLKGLDKLLAYIKCAEKGGKGSYAGKGIGSRGDKEISSFCFGACQPNHERQSSNNS